MNTQKTHSGIPFRCLPVKVTDLVLSPVPAVLAILFFLCGCTYDGDALFHEQGCITCHQFKGKGGMMGPDLTAVGARRSREWIDQYLGDPKRQYPQARMPAFRDLSKQKRQAIIDFLTE
jgi:cytochrome c2